MAGRLAQGIGGEPAGYGVSLRDMSLRWDCAKGVVSAAYSEPPWAIGQLPQLTDLL
jgi:hypothetical protein